MVLISDFHAAPVDVLERGAPAWPFRSGRSDGPTLIDATGSVAALRRRACVAPAALADRSPTMGTRLVGATDVDGDLWWIPAAAVWSDATTAPIPQRPLPVGLATATSPQRAMVSGLSDRLGWEAVMEFERGTELPVIEDASGTIDVHRLVVLDGRVGHDIPTVLLLGDDVLRWGAGATWADAMNRALYGHDQGGDHDVELVTISRRLAAGGLAPAAVDLGTPALRRCGIIRSSVQLLTAIA
ncbi:MAG: hypothetical protein H0W46_07650 [Acidimicrobiia bacterium]|nr:hypothetical protein [Acidimicrobiia bacterium]